NEPAAAVEPATGQLATADAGRSGGRPQQGTATATTTGSPSMANMPKPAGPPRGGGAATPTGGAAEPPPGGPETPARPAEPSDAWRTAADDGWRAASALADVQYTETTQAGLPKRKPMAQLVPGGVTQNASTAQRRTPEGVRGLLSAYHRGVQRGRTQPKENRSTDTQPTPAGPQSAPAGKEHDA
ncbi:MAG TPA: ATPase, partial [Pilimelia sp.]|nr:ATPase [Pilimelia sp.]